MKHPKQNTSFRLKFFHLIFWSLLAASALAAGAPEENVIKPAPQDAGAVVQLQSSIARHRQVLSNASPNAKIRLFARLADKEKTEKAGYFIPSSKVVKVANPKSWPEQTITSFIVLLRDDGSVAALQEVPTSESGDWNNGYTHYFDQAGNTIVFEHTSSFFNACPGATGEVEPSFLETSTYFYKDHKLLAKDYAFVVTTGGKEKPMSPAKCEFNYRHPYTIHPNWAAAMKATGIAQAWPGKP